MGRSRAVLVSVLVVVLALASCTYEASEGEDATIATSEPDPRRVVADAIGTGAEVCEAAGGGEVLADESFDLEAVRWVFCSGDDVVSLRSVGGGEWEARSLPITGDDTLVVTVADAARAWVTHDGLDSAAHEHIWTADEGRTWVRIIPGAP